MAMQWSEQNLTSDFSQGAIYGVCHPASWLFMKNTLLTMKFPPSLRRQLPLVSSATLGPRQLVGSQRVVAIAIQGACSYSVYAGDNLEYVVQCRLRSLALKTEVSELATEIYGSLVPTVFFKGVLGDATEDVKTGDREPLYVYLMSRMPGITQLDFVLSQDFSQDSPEYFPLRQKFIGDVAQ